MNQSRENENSEIIESESVDQEVPESTAVTKGENKGNTPVVIKKSGFLSFLAFLLAALALASSAYLYMEMKKQSSSSDNKEWQSMLADAENRNEQTFSQFANQIKNLQTTNNELQNQLNAVKTTLSNTQPADAVVSSEKYDDSQLIQKIQTLQTQLDNQVNSFNQMKTAVDENKNKQSQEILQLTKKLNNSPPPSDRLTLINKNYKYDMAERYMQAAHQQLSFYSNVVKGQEYLKQTIAQFSILEGEGYKNLSLEIRKISEDLRQNPPLNISQIKQQIEDLAKQSNELSFDQSIKTKQPDEESSWYDKLVVIRKVDDSKGVKLTNAEQEKVFQSLTNHYSTMKVALVSKNQTLWKDEIKALNALLGKYFPDQSKVINEKLSDLNAQNLNPILPDLTKYIDALKVLNNNEFNELELPVIEKSES